jgi:hypothetical protein
MSLVQKGIACLVLFFFPIFASEKKSCPKYTNLELALIEFEKVCELDLSNQKLEEFPKEILKLFNRT